VMTALTEFLKLVILERGNNIANKGFRKSVLSINIE